MHTHIHSFLTQLQLRNDGVPIYVQIREQFLAAIASGLLAAGDQLPTMREVAVALKVDLNTVRHAYDELARRGAIELVRGRGSFVANHPSPAAVGPQFSLDCAERACPIDADPLDRLALDAIAQSLEAGFTPADLAHRILRLGKGA
jgi:GntR family transcriptional regulator